MAYLWQLSVIYGATFPGLEGQKQNDTIVVATIHLRKLMRALWTANGASGMEVMIDVLPAPTHKSPSEIDLLLHFSGLRDIKQVVVSGVSESRCIDQLTCVITAMDGVERSFAELYVYVEDLRGYIKAERWRHAVRRAKTLSILLNDCKIVYGNRFVGIEPGIKTTTAIACSRMSKDLFIATAMGIAEISLYQRKYPRAVRFADRALELFSRISFFQLFNLNVVTPPFNSFLSITGTVAVENETKCSILLIRARAFMGMCKAMLALRDIEKARELVPNSVALASVSQAWHVMFDPIPGFNSPPSTAASSFSALRVALFDPTDEMDIDFFAADDEMDID